MISEDKKLAVVIELQGEMESQSRLAWKTLAENLSVDFIPSMSVAPHITIDSGFRGNHKSVCELLGDIALQTSSFTMCGNGIGVFITESPVVHVRWLLNEKINKFKCKLGDALEEANRNNKISEYEKDYNWLAKTTLAFNDTNYTNLVDVVNIVRILDFKQKMIVNKFALYEYSLDEGENKIAQFDFLKT